MSAALQKRADTIRAHFKMLEGVKGSGHHDDDRNPANPNLFAAPQKNGLPRASDHLVPFFDHYDLEQVTFAGTDATRALAALQAHHAKIEAKLKAAEKQGQDPWSAIVGTERKLRHLVPKLSLETVGGGSVLKLWLCDWNDYIAALYAEGLGLSGANLVE